MAQRKAGFGVKFNNDQGVPITVLLDDPGSSIPFGGDLCTITAAGLPTFQVTSTGTAATLLLSYICCDGFNDGRDYMNNPGYTAYGANTFAKSQFGGRSAQLGNTQAKKKFYMPLSKNLWFLMDVNDANTTLVVGTSYGVTRVSSGYYVVDQANANACVTVRAVYEADGALGLGLGPFTGTIPQFGAVTNRHAAVWVSAVGGQFV